MDMTHTIAPKSDQMNSDDLISGPVTIRITRVAANEGSPEQPVKVFYDGDGGKPYMPCKSMRRVMVAAWGADAAKYPGRSMTLYRDPNVAFGGMAVGGIRISYMSDISSEMTLALTATRANRKPFTVRPLKLDREHPVLAKARAIAATGKEAFVEFFNSDEGKDHRDQIKTILPTLQKIANEADAARQAEDPFTPPDHKPDPETMARIEREVREQSEREAAEYGN